MELQLHDRDKSKAHSRTSWAFYLRTYAIVSTESCLPARDRGNRTLRATNHGRNSARSNNTNSAERRKHGGCGPLSSSTPSPSPRGPRRRRNPNPPCRGGSPKAPIQIAGEAAPTGASSAPTTLPDSTSQVPTHHHSHRFVTVSPVCPDEGWVGGLLAARATAVLQQRPRSHLWVLLKGRGGGGCLPRRPGTKEIQDLAQAVRASKHRCRGGAVRVMLSRSPCINSMAPCFGARRTSYRLTMRLTTIASSMSASPLPAQP